jgi:hypothetical protein
MPRPWVMRPCTFGWTCSSRALAWSDAEHHLMARPWVCGPFITLAGRPRPAGARSASAPAPPPATVTTVNTLPQQYNITTPCEWSPAETWATDPRGCNPQLIRLGSRDQSLLDVYSPGYAMTGSGRVSSPSYHTPHPRGSSHRPGWTGGGPQGSPPRCASAPSTPRRGPRG